MKVSIRVACLVLFLAFYGAGTESTTTQYPNEQLYSRLERLLTDLQAVQARVGERLSGRNVHGRPAGVMKATRGNTMVHGLFQADVGELSNGTVVKSVKALTSLLVPCLGAVPVVPVTGDAMTSPASIAVTAVANGTRTVNVTFPYQWTLDPGTEEGRCATSVAVVPGACRAPPLSWPSQAVNGTAGLTVAWDVEDRDLASVVNLSFYILVECKFYTSHGP